MATTAAIPIVFGVADDPVKWGLVASLARPKSNATGINFLTSEVVTKRLTLLHELAPGATRIVILLNSADPARSESMLKDVESAARVLALQTHVLNASTNQEIDQRLRNARARTRRRAFCQPRRLLQHPARPARYADGALRHSGGLFCA